MLDNEATHIVLCEVEPTAYRLCSIGAANCLGYKSFGAGNAFNGPSAHSVNGRYVASTQVTDGTIVTSDTVAWWAAIDSAANRLLAHQAMASGGTAEAGQQFSLASFNVRLPSSN